MIKKLAFTLAVLWCASASSQQLLWIGTSANQDFFDESNWVDNITLLPPAAGSIDPNVSINSDLVVQDYATAISANGVINLGTGSLSITTSNIWAEAISGGNVQINDQGYLDLTDTQPLQNSTTINFTSGIAWVRATNMKVVAFLNTHLSQIFVNQQAAVHKTNIRLDNYYFNGTVIRSQDTSSASLIIYDNANRQGNPVNISIDVVHSGTGIPSTMNNKLESFVLRKGYMATFAVADDGTGKSKNYIAAEADLIVDLMPVYLQNNVSFIRVIPWNWVSKKGRTKDLSDLNTTWNYRWNNIGESSLEQEYVPMAWGAGGANDDADITLYKSKYKATHVMAFNESDNCNDQSGQFNNLCQTDVAVGFYKNLMKTGLRLVSPSTRENGPFGWLKEFYDKATAQDVRIDVIGVHWYDWGSTPTNSPNANPVDVFNRFKKYLQDVYNLYGLPIWISEFNANPNRSTATNLGFMQLALPYLETLDYVERYNWFEPSSGTADFYDSSGVVLTDVGTFYKNQLSTPAISDDVVTADNNLDIFFKQANNLIANGDFELGNLNGWSGANINTLTNNPFEGTTSGRILAGAGNIQQTVTVESLADYDLSFYTKWFVAPSAPISVQILNAATNAVIASQLMTTNLNWNLVSLRFTVPSGVNSIKFLVSKAGEPGWFIDNAILLKTGQTLSLKEFETSRISLFPNPSSSVFTISAKTPISAYSIYNSQGQLIERKTNLMLLEVSINLIHQKRGIYFVSILDDKSKTFTKKIILN
jgi:hypothetical protein